MGGRLADTDKAANPTASSTAAPHMSAVSLSLQVGLELYGAEAAQFISAQKFGECRLGRPGGSS